MSYHSGPASFPLHCSDSLWPFVFFTVPPLCPIPYPSLCPSLYPSFCPPFYISPCPLLYPSLFPICGWAGNLLTSVASLHHPSFVQEISLSLFCTLPSIVSSPASTPLGFVPSAWLQSHSLMVAGLKGQSPVRQSMTIWPSSCIVLPALLSSWTD